MSIPKTVGRYEITELLGQGGMGTVYKAFDPLLARVVAIKVISAQLHAQPELRDRFFREARAAAQLAHRNIIVIHDLGEEDGLPFLAMQFLEGRDLEQRMRAPEGMSLSRKFEVALAMTEGLAHAHSAGVVHRDIKPANVFITHDGQVKILDFGLARLVTSELTRSNVMVGTVNYMAPEQLRGEKTDHRSDIFSLGVVLYEMFGGKKPFQADSFASTMYKILQETPEPLETLSPELPPALVAAVDRSIAKAREDRYQFMIDLLRDLEVIYEPMRGSDRRIVSQVESALRPISEAKTKSHPPVSTDDLPTMVGSPIPHAIRPPSGGQTGLDPMVPAIPTPPTPMPPAGVSPTPAPDVIEKGRSWWPYALGAAGLVAVALAVVALNRRGGTPPVYAPPAAARSAPGTGVSVPPPPTAEPTPPEPRQAEPVDTNPNEAEKTEPAAQASVPDPVAARISNAMRRAQSAMAAGHYDEAELAASEVLVLDRSNREARQLMARITAIGREHVKRSTTAVIAAKAAAVAANARELAPDVFADAERQETAAREASQRQQFESAAVRLDAATTLFKSAEQTARDESEARAARTKAAEEARKAAERTERPEPPEKPEPPPPAPAPAPAVPAPPRPETVTVPPQTRTVREGVAAVLQRYTAALEHRDIAALKSVWPSLGGSGQAAIENDFNNSRSIEVSFAEPKIDIAGTTATISGLRQYSLRTKDGQQLRSVTMTTLALRQVGNDWIIESVRHQAAR